MSAPHPRIGSTRQGSEQVAAGEVTLFSAISGSSGLGVLVVLAVVATVWVILTARGSRPKKD